MATMYSFLRKIVPLLVLFCSASFILGQVATGTYNYGTFDNKGFDTINVGNLNVHFAIPVLHKAGRGTPFVYDLSYDSSFWRPVTTNGSSVWQRTATFGWSGSTDPITGYVGSVQSVSVPPGPPCTVTTQSYGGYVYYDTLRQPHPFNGS